jgi:predicted dehydrogenase
VADLRCAFVGCGGVAAEYFDVYRNHPGVRVTACIDTDIHRAKAAAARFAGNGGVVLASGDFADAMKPEIDLLVINTPNYLHREQAVAALRHNKHVFLQKPIASTLEDAMAILQASRESKGVAGVYMSYFDHPVVHDFKAMAEQGWFGEISQMHGRLMHTNGVLWSNETLNGKPSWRGSILQTGGGAFIQLAVHYFRTMCWLTGQRVERITGFSSSLKCVGLEGEDTAVAILEFSEGAQATLNLSWCTRGEELSIHGTKGSMTYLDNQQTRLQSSESFDGKLLHYTGPKEQYAACPTVSHGDASQPTNQHCVFLEALAKGEPPFVSVESAVEDMAVVKAFYESIRSGKSVEVAPLFAEAARCQAPARA